MRTRSLLAAALTLTVSPLLLLLIGGAPAAHACGAFFPSVAAQDLAVDAQRALIVVHRLELDVHLQMAATHDGDDFAWIIPVPTTPSLSLGDAAVFEALEAETRPTVTLPSGSSGGGGFCGSDAAGLGDSDVTGVTRFGGGILGDYAWDVVGGTDPNAITQWLDANGYVLPEGAAATLAIYTDMGMRFVAVRLTAGADRDDDLAPLVLTMETPGDRRLRYPLEIMSLSARAVNPVIVWTLADKRYRVANYGSVTVEAVGDALRARLDAGETVDYAEALDDLTDAGEGRLFVTEYAQSLDAADLPAALGALVDGEAFYLTRLHARVPRASLADAIVTFANEAPDVSPHVVADAGDPRLRGLLASGWPVALLLLLGWRAGVRGRRASPRART